MERFTISPALTADLQTILELQYLAFRSEAEMLDDFSIPPMRQTPEMIRAEWEQGTILKAVDENGRIVGSVRGYCDGDTTHVGKLIVHPCSQRMGLGRRLLEAIEQTLPSQRYELFTSHHSLRNLAMYRRAGYVPFREQALPSGVRLIYLEKYNDR